MIKRAVSKAMRVGRGTVLMVGLSVMLAMVFGLATTAVAGNGIGGVFNLGQKNTVNRLSQLVGAPTAGAMLRVDNDGTGTALDLKVGQGTDPTTKTAPPMTVDSQVKVTNLNSDELDGFDSTEFALTIHDHDSSYYTETESDNRFVNETDHTKAAHDALDIDADTVDGKNSTDFQNSYKRTVVVSPVPNSAQASGAALESALAGITATQSNPALLKIEPGVYDLGAAPGLQMKQWVDIEGSGELNTKIRCACGTPDGFGSDAVVKGSNNAELRFLTVENTGGGLAESVSVAIRNQTASPRLTHVTAIASGGTRNFGVRTFGSFGSVTSPLMTAVTVTATGGNESYGVYSAGFSSPRMTDVTATATGGSHNFGVFNSQSSSQMTNVAATASGGTNSYGVYNDQAHHNGTSPRMTDVTATASGSTNNYGVYSIGLSSILMTDVSATASGGTESYGLRNGGSSSPIIQGGTFKASGASATNIALSNNGGTTQVRNAHLVVPSSAAGGKTIYNNAGADVKVGGSLLEGAGVQNDDTALDRFTCVASYNGSYAPLDENCT